MSWMRKVSGINFRPVIDEGCFKRPPASYLLEADALAGGAGEVEEGVEGAAGHDGGVGPVELRVCLLQDRDLRGGDAHAPTHTDAHGATH